MGGGGALHALFTPSLLLICSANYELSEINACYRQRSVELRILSLLLIFDKPAYLTQLLPFTALPDPAVGFGGPTRPTCGNLLPEKS